MKRTLLISGNRADFTVLEVDLDEKALTVVSNFPAPFNVSWVERASSQGWLDHLIGLSEGTESGLLYTFDIDHAQKSCQITSQQPTLGAPAHFTTLKDGSALALGTYLGGSIALYPITCTDKDGVLLTDAPRTELCPDFAYQPVAHGPVPDRQRQCHVHQILEDKKGLLYAPDLGSDRVWILSREQEKIKVCGWLQCPPGTGARHAVFSPDESTIYVLGELSHKISAFDLATAPAEDIQPIEGFASTIVPPKVHPDHQSMMDSAELCSHPSIPNVLYASNRWERHIAKREPHLQHVPKELPPGDSVAIILLSADGKRVEETKFVQTKLDVIRGMRLSDDGQYVLLCGQEGGGIEIYSIRGKRGDVWTHVTSLVEGLESGIKHGIWL